MGNKKTGQLTRFGQEGCFFFLPYNGKKGKERVTMEYRILGKTGLKISRMGFGGIPIQRIDAEGTKALMHKLLENGVNYIDTARGYTVSEEYLGIGLEGIREHFVLATKSMSRTAEAMAKDIDISLKNLRTDYIDLYQIHNAPPADVEKVCSPGGALEALTAAKKAGKIGHIGITAHSLKPSGWRWSCRGWRPSCSHTISWKIRQKN